MVATNIAAILLNLHGLHCKHINNLQKEKRKKKEVACRTASKLVYSRRFSGRSSPYSCRNDPRLHISHMFRGAASIPLPPSQSWSHPYNKKKANRKNHKHKQQKEKKLLTQTANMVSFVAQASHQKRLLRKTTNIVRVSRTGKNH